MAERARAAGVLANHAHPVVVRRLGEVLRNDAAEAVRIAAVDSLVSLGTEEALCLVGNALEDNSTSVQLEAALGLLSRRAVPGVLQLLESGKRRVSPIVSRIVDAELTPTAPEAVSEDHTTLG